jgi:hypothetical protein
MKEAQIIKKLFPNKNQLQLSSIWFEVFETEITAMTGKPFINPIRLDEIYQKEYGEYEGSFRDAVLERFGEDILLELTR